MGINSEPSCSLMTDHHYTAVFVLEQNNTIRVDRGRFDTERICTNEPKQSQTPELQTSVYRQYSQCWPTEKITVHSVRTALSVCSLKHMHIQAVCLLHFSTYYPQATTAPLSFVCLCLFLLRCLFSMQRHQRISGNHWTFHGATHLLCFISVIIFRYFTTVLFVFGVFLSPYLPVNVFPWSPTWGEQVGAQPFKDCSESCSLGSYSFKRKNSAASKPT